MSTTLHARYTDENNKVSVMRHQCWDADLFVRTRSKDASNLNASQKDPAKQNASFCVITEAEYKVLK